ncbi:MAG: PLDc N-terminal domain-containing protein [Planctomycetota bacterium]|nr:PLDc N-terminal domain-containing protein [Planctomycetota bacterium]
MAIFGLLFIVVGVLVAIAATIFWIMMLIDCLTSNLPSTEKLVWVIVILFLHIVGAILYAVIAKSGRTRLT